ncbi:MAG: CDP-glycerol glycerophosphotransferase family protein [Fidelibacterota bacterium]
MDYVVARNVVGLLGNCRIIAKNRALKDDLIKNYNVGRCGLYPAFPDVLIAARHIARKFPEKRILKIGMRHGAYHFKDFVSAKRYHAFNYFLVTSRREVELAREKGIHNTVAIGYPKLDDAFNGKITDDDLKKFREKLKIDHNKPTVIFTATWEKSGMSAVDRWSSGLADLTDEFNILVSLHAWVPAAVRKLIRNTPGVYYVDSKDILPYLMVSDVMVSDTSSIIAEFCALDKPIITFRTGRGKRTSDEILEMLEKISFRVTSFGELTIALQRAISEPRLHADARHYFNQIMFDALDGKAGVRAAEFIKTKVYSKRDHGRGHAI